MEGSKEEETNMEANRFPLERQPLGTSTQTMEDDREPPPQSPCFEVSELRAWSFYRAGIAEFIATFLFMYVSILTVLGVNNAPGKCSTVGPQGIAWAFGGMIFVLVYCTAGVSGGHINPAVTFGFLLIRKISIIRAIFYTVMQCAGAICGAGVVKVFLESQYELLGGGINTVVPGHHEFSAFFAEIFGTFVLIYAVFSASDTKRNAKDSYLPVFAPLPIGFAVFLVHLATMPISKTGINPARSVGAAVIYNKEDAFDNQWIFWIGPLIGAALAALYHRIILRPVTFRCCSF